MKRIRLSPPNAQRLRRRLATEALERREMLAGDVLNGIAPFADEPQRIVGGNLASPGEYPWMVSLQGLDGDHFCGGSLIAPDRVLTAAHCLEGESAEDLQVSVGAYKLSEQDGEVFEIDEIFVHPFYDSFSSDSDVAVLKLSAASSQEPVAFAREADAALFAPGEDGVTIGWGDRSSGGRGSNRLREVTVPIVSNADANDPLSYGGEVTENMIAAGIEGRDSCQGDSGGPLVVFDTDNNPIVAGIVGWGYGCGDEGFPGIYARVSNFTEYIESPESFVTDGPDDHGNNSQTATAVSDGTYAGRLEIPNDIDWFRFRAESGAVIVAETFLGSLDDTILFLYDSNGRTVLAENDDFDGFASRIEFSVETKGNYYLVVKGFSHSEGDYQLKVSGTIPNDDHGDDAESASPVSDGRYGASIEATKDVDWFQFQVDNGAEVSLTVNVNTLDEAAITLYDTDGTTVLDQAKNNGEPSASLSWKARAAGSYYVSIAGGDATTTGTYELNVKGVRNFDDHSNSSSNATPVTNAVDGNIERPNDVDWFSFHAEARASVEIATELFSLRDSYLTLYDTDGSTVLAETDEDSGADSPISWNAPADGVYFVTVTSFGMTAAGSYRLTINTVPPDDHGNDAATATPISNGRYAGTIDEDGDVDWFSFRANAGATFVVQTTLDTLGDSVLSLYDADSHLLKENDDFIGTASRILWTAETTGVFYVAVEAWDRTDFGDYVLEIEGAIDDDHGNDAASATRVSFDAPPVRVDGNLEQTDDSDWFRLELPASVIRVGTSLGTLSDATVTVRDDGGTVIEAEEVTESAESHFLLRASDSGTYYIEVSSKANELGSYSMLLSEVLKGDVNLDGIVNAADLNQIALRWQQTNESFDWEDGDLTGDGSIDAADLNELGRNWRAEASRQLRAADTLRRSADTLRRSANTLRRANHDCRLRSPTAREIVFAERFAHFSVATTWRQSDS